MSKKVQRKCGTCKWLRPRSDGKPFYHSHTYACLYAFPKIKWPASMREDAYNSPMREMEKPIRGYMEPRDGKDCPCWEAFS